MSRAAPSTKDEAQSVAVRRATAADTCWAPIISEMIATAAKEPGVALALRAPNYIAAKITQGKAVVAFNLEGELCGFCYLETWSDEKYVAHSGLVVDPRYRHLGLGRKIKQEIFALSRELYPHAKLFGLTTSPSVLRINAELGYRASSFAELTEDDQFWEGCKSCPYYDILVRLKRRVCLCTGLIYDPAEHSTLVPLRPRRERN